VIIDTHCHLDDIRYDEDLEAVLKRADEAGVTKHIIPGADPKTLQRAIAIAEKYDSVYFAVGVHPYDANAYDRELLEHYITHPKCVAVGECGLDYYRLPEEEDAIEAEKVLQKEVFIDQIALAKAYEKPLIVHIREASSDAKRLLEVHAGSVGGVLHCFNADATLLSLAKEHFYYGIGGVLTFKNAKKLLNVLPQIPKERLLIETDAPYLTPHPFRGKRNEPAYCTYVAEKMASLLDMPVEEIATLTTANAQRLFGV